MGTKKIRHKNYPNLTLSYELASSIAEKIKKGEPLFTEDEYKMNASVDFPVKDGVISVKPYTYNRWIKERVKVPDTNRTLYSIVMEARHEARMKKHEENQKKLVLEAQNYLTALQKLPIGTKTRRVLKKYRLIKGDGRVQTHEEDETIETPVDPRMVTIKQKTSEFLLERLDPAYKKGAESNVNIMVNLGELRRQKEQREPVKEVPKEDYTVKEQ